MDTRQSKAEKEDAESSAVRLPKSASPACAKKVRRILGIDPGFASTGWGVLDFCESRFRHVAHGVIETKSATRHSERLCQIYDGIVSVLERFSPDEASMEDLFFSKNVTSAMAVAEARGVLQLCLFQRGIPCRQFKPNEIKQNVTGAGSADKKLVQGGVKFLLGLAEIPKPDHAADALAVAICCAHSPVFSIAT